MANKNIEFVKRWLAGEVFSVEALQGNAKAAAYAEAVLWDDENPSHAAATAYAAYRAASGAADAAFWIKQYEELANDK